MPPGRLLRDNAFIVAALVLPVLVAGFFLAASIVPRWTVPPPAYDLVLKVQRSYNDTSRAGTSLDFEVRDRRVVAVVTPVAANSYARRWALLVVDHTTLRAREIPATAPGQLPEGEPERATIVPELAGMLVSTSLEAPDGYALRTTASGGPGLPGAIFGMSSYRQRTTLSGRGRTVRVELPAPFQEPYLSTTFLGWVTPDGRP